MRTHLSLLLLLATACSKGDDGVEDTDVIDTDPVDDTELSDTVDRETYITVTETVVGDMTCVPEDGTSWQTQTIDPSCVDEVPLEGKIEDFQTGDPVLGMEIEIFLGDDPSGTADFVAHSDTSGIVTGGSIPTCTPFASRAVNPSDPASPPALQMHWSESHKTPMDAFFNSVDASTLGLMSALLGVTPDTTKGFAAGTIYACVNRRDLVENAQVILRSEDGTYPREQSIHYFKSEFPSRTETATSEDGLFLIVNVPPGKYTIEAWAVLADGEAPTLIAQTETQLFAGALTVADVYTGTEDGVWLPDSCTTACDPLMVP